MVIDIESYLRRHINCPLCGQRQKMVRAPNSKIWFPYAPFCCDAMRYLDTPEWNTLLDKAIDNVQ
jgi:hypothetical protein